ncbi:MAG: FlgD immunoglobulin-like domain containing protein [candidate division FCPU426 bacterium]
MKKQGFRVFCAVLLFSGLAAPARPATFGEQGTGTYTTYDLYGRQRASQFVCGETGSVNRIFMYLYSAGSLDDCRVAIYASGGLNIPGALLAESASQPAVAGWNEFVIPTVAVTSGSTYWLAMQTNDTNTTLELCMYLDADPDKAKGHDLAYGPFSNPFGTIDITWNRRYCLYATEILPTPTPSSTVTPTPSFTRSSTPTFTATRSPTFTGTPTPSFTPTPSPSATATATPSSTGSHTPTFTASATFSPSTTSTPSATDTPTRTATATPFNVFTATATPTPTLTAVSLETATSSPSSTPTPTSTPAPLATGIVIRNNVIRPGLGQALGVEVPVPAAQRVSVKIYDQLGQPAATLWDGQAEAGLLALRWQGRDQRNQPAPSGVYILIVKTPQAEVRRKVVVIR